uniref:Uncharacterized protein n=1 Tax=Theropithecus gelada TaxID=9565 RepID=A0A8D2F2Q8_THEGE
WAVLFMSKVGLRGDRRSEDDEVLDPLRQAPDSSMQSHSLYQHPQRLAFHVAAPVASTVQQASSFLVPLPHLSSFVPQPEHSLLPPLGSHGAEVSKKMAECVCIYTVFCLSIYLSTDTWVASISWLL